MSDLLSARDLLTFYQEAGVDSLVGETPVDRFADPVPRPAKVPSQSADSSERAGGPSARAPRFHRRNFAHAGRHSIGRRTSAVAG